MKVIVDADAQRAHRPRQFIAAGRPKPSPEVPERLDRLLAAALEAGHTVAAPPTIDESAFLGAIRAVHTADYVTFLQTAFERWRRIGGASDFVLPNVHPGQGAGSYPDSVVGQAGYHLYDTACPIDAQTWTSAAASANAAIHAASLVRDGTEDRVYALCRPPGHHAGAAATGGFCYLNNAAIAAQVLRGRFDRVAVLDVDLHHGNGTQDIFYLRSDVLTVSIHADPAHYYPFFWGYAHQTGAEAGRGHNLNLPRPLGTGDDGFLAALDQAVARIDAFAPGALVVALGLDAFIGDPFAGLAVTTPGFGRIGEAIGALRRPTVLVQEGGYPSDALGDNLVAVLEGVEQGAR